MILLQFQPKKPPSWPMPIDGWPPFTVGLANKMQRLAGESPHHLRLVERFVDLLLIRLDLEV